MVISTELVSEALMIAAIVLTAFAIPKLIAYFVWAIYKMWIYKNLDRVSRSAFFKSVVRGDVYEEFVKQSDKIAVRFKWMSKAYMDYLREIKEPAVEGFTAVVLVLVVLGYIGLEPPLPQIFRGLAITLAIF